ncbi:MAG: zinc finger domain-containing protein [Terriglobales bacterium]
MTLICPRCKARPGKVCRTPHKSELETVHLERIEAAAAVDAAARRPR